MFPNSELGRSPNEYGTFFLVNLISSSGVVGFLNTQQYSQNWVSGCEKFLASLTKLGCRQMFAEFPIRQDSFILDKGLQLLLHIPSCHFGKNVENTYRATIYQLRRVFVILGNSNDYCEPTTFWKTLKSRKTVYNIQQYWHLLDASMICFPCEPFFVSALLIKGDCPNRTTLSFTLMFVALIVVAEKSHRQLLPSPFLGRQSFVLCGSSLEHVINCRRLLYLGLPRMLLANTGLCGSGASYRPSSVAT